MNKTELLAQIDELLEQSIDAYEVTDLKVDEGDHGALYSIAAYLEDVVQCLRKARRAGRVLREEYNDDLSKKPEYMEQGDDEDEDEDEDADGDDD
jgi:hypothetical protein